eukprot:TRINITY_DN669_c0_g1_i1.p4 TRINITY_DN669_c0_g1~~TRINITY_DN669_c0_g1_i1.p4  ORF type:complete len:788 (+),score=124.43 TRINITY_DN669_c0_g1_i1:17648-20011(+)
MLYQASYLNMQKMETIVEFLEKATPEAWRNIPKCLTDTLRSVITLLLNHEIRLQAFSEFETRQCETNATTDKRFASIEENMVKEFDETNERINNGLKDSIKNAQDLHHQAEDQAEILAEQLREQAEKAKKFAEDVEAQRGAVMKKIGEIDVKLFKQRQELTENINNSVNEAKHELSNCAGLYGESEYYKTLGTYLMAMKKDFIEGLKDQSQELKTEITIESSKLGQRLDTVENLVKMIKGKEEKASKIVNGDSGEAVQLIKESLQEKYEEKQTLLEEEIKNMNKEIAKFEDLQKHHQEETGKLFEDVVRLRKENEDIAKNIEAQKNIIDTYKKYLDELSEKFDIEIMNKTTTVPENNEVAVSIPSTAIEGLEKKIRNLSEKLSQRIEEAKAENEISVNRINIQLKDLKAAMSGINTESNRSSVYERLAKNTPASPSQEIAGGSKSKVYEHSAKNTLTSQEIAEGPKSKPYETSGKNTLNSQEIVEGPKSKSYECPINNTQKTTEGLKSKHYEHSAKNTFTPQETAETTKSKIYEQQQAKNTPGSREIAETNSRPKTREQSIKNTRARIFYKLTISTFLYIYIASEAKQFSRSTAGKLMENQVLQMQYYTFPLNTLPQEVTGSKRSSPHENPPESKPSKNVIGESTQKSNEDRPSTNKASRKSSQDIPPKNYQADLEPDQDMTQLAENYTEDLVSVQSRNVSPQTPGKPAVKLEPTDSITSPIKPKEILIEAKTREEQPVEEEKKVGVDKKFRETSKNFIQHNDLNSDKQYEVQARFDEYFQAAACAK